MAFMEQTPEPDEVPTVVIPAAPEPSPIEAPPTDDLIEPPIIDTGDIPDPVRPTSSFAEVETAKVTVHHGSTLTTLVASEVVHTTAGLWVTFKSVRRFYPWPTVAWVDVLTLSVDHEPF